jgi:hypothetical protein
MTVTFAPARPASNAAANPEIPVPTMTTSAFGGDVAEFSASAPSELDPIPHKTALNNPQAVMQAGGALALRFT